MNSRYINSISLLVFCFSVVTWGQPTCEVEKRSSNLKLGIASGLASGFEIGKIYITLTNGSRKYTTVAEKDGRWAISFADLEKKSEVLCWQEGNGLNASYSWERN